MSRYIDVELIDYDDYWNNKGFSTRDCLQAQQLIEKQPTADVVEREKIDKAIKVVNDYISATFKMGLNDRAFGMREILEVFMKNIREQTMEESEDKE